MVLSCTDRSKDADLAGLSSDVRSLRGVASIIQGSLQQVERKLDASLNVERGGSLSSSDARLESISQVTRETKEMTVSLKMQQQNVEMALQSICRAADSMRGIAAAMSNVTGQQAQMETKLAMNQQLRLEDIKQLIQTQLDNMVKLHIQPMSLTLGVVREQTAQPKVCLNIEDGSRTIPFDTQFQQAVTAYMSPRTKDPTDAIEKFKRPRSRTPHAELKTELRRELENLEKSLLAQLQNHQHDYLKAERDATADDFCKKMEILLHDVQPGTSERETPKGQFLNQLDWLPVQAPPPLRPMPSEAEKRYADEILSSGSFTDSPNAPRGTSSSPSVLNSESAQRVADSLAEEPYDEDEEQRRADNLKVQEDNGMQSIFVHDSDLEKPLYRVEDHFKTTGFCQAVVRNPTFSTATMIIVVLNAVWIGVESDHNQANNFYDANPFFQIVSQLFCIFFTFEWLVRLFAFENMRAAFEDGWIKFDTFLVATMVLETWVLMPILKIAAGSGNIKVPTQPLRMLRLAKLTRMARLMRAFPELVMMIKGLFRSLRAIASSLILIALMMYTWALILHMLLKEEDTFNGRLRRLYGYDFSRMVDCMWSLLVGGTLMLDNSGPLMHGMLFSKQFKPFVAGVFFILYGLLSAFLILQMLIGVLCDVVARVGQEQREATAISLVKQELLVKLKEFDNGDGKISNEELTTIMTDPRSRAVFRKLNINLIFLRELQEMMFTTPEAQVPIKAVLELMITCRGDTNATVDTMAKGFCYVSRELRGLKKLMANQLHSSSHRHNRD